MESPEQEAKFKKHSIGAVIVSPTKLAAKQIRDVAEPFLQSLTEILDEDDDDDVESKEHAKFSPDVRPMLVGGTQTVADDLKRFSRLGSLCLINLALVGC